MNKSKRKIHITIYLAILISAYLVSKYMFQIMLIQGTSMEPTLKNYQMVILNKNISEVTYGDIISAYCDGIDGVIVKRVIAVSGDAVVIREGVLYVNEHKSIYVKNNKDIRYSGCLKKKYVIPDKCYFVVGDNINHSIDSRYDAIGVVQYENISGIVICRK